MVYGPSKRKEELFPLLTEEDREKEGSIELKKLDFKLSL